jgi:hypothetical protein
MKTPLVIPACPESFYIFKILMNNLMKPHGSHSGPAPESSDSKRQRYWITAEVNPELDTVPV